MPAAWLIEDVGELPHTRSGWLPELGSQEGLAFLGVVGASARQHLPAAPRAAFHVTAGDVVLSLYNSAIRTRPPVGAPILRLVAIADAVASLPTDFVYCFALGVLDE